MAVAPHTLEQALRELIAALDRRMPHVERAGEVSIAREAAALRQKAVARLAELARPTLNGEVRPESLADTRGGKSS